ncbi:MAG: hypothetical protein M0P01_11820 [Treponema sp.]|nr:hypothetical protein [Treponema sp.]
METILSVNGTDYTVIKLLGKGKGGYSYLVSLNTGKFVLKQIHHEPCSYYQFGNKIEAEKNDYARLFTVGIRMPGLIAVDEGNERILKEYIDGSTISELVQQNKIRDSYIAQVKEMCRLLYPAGLNIDYFPANFVVQNELLYYIDFECNIYSDKWNFENWGVKYWVKS